MIKGGEFWIALDLYNELHKFKYQTANRSRTIHILREWWNTPANKNLRLSTVDAHESLVRFYYSMLGMRETGNDAAYTANYVPEAWEALRRWAYEKNEKKEHVPEGVYKILLRPEGAPKKTGRRMGATHKKMFTSRMLALMVKHVRSTTPFKSLEATGKTTDRAFDIVAEAAGVSPDVVRHAWKLFKQTQSFNEQAFRRPEER